MEHGIMVGFDCPPVQSQTRFCCGTESKRYCCTRKDGDGDIIVDHDNSKLLYIISSNSNVNLVSPSASSSPTYRILSSPSLTSFSNIYFSLPILISVLVGILAVIFIILFGLLMCRHRSHNKEQQQKKKQQQNKTLLDTMNPPVDPHTQYPFSHHQHYLTMDENQNYDHNLHTSDTTTTTATSSSSSGRTNSGLLTMNFNDWKEFVVSESTPMNLYLTMSSNSTDEPYSGYMKKNHQMI
ncbi:unnamed protein product [Didymodactylos carnosus]|uniref:Shisa N-terminal domain-containing protein n=1 Tax=Didymodactylos carnosus TaxID=1234261 RepID=A0A813Y8Z5_9BILA|nr:unnamed protein product [Didymodactylos carnosus]CAF0990349.1 unnamed protein product [Didymodactylos carnosus]CAF3667010.1 unnamed protein product [Didymodactylos carnosus]CAF3760431.1 unnamed protein product [Didymodactylos carnosus]